MASSVTSCTLDTTGISAPPYNDILTYLVDQYTSIFGSDSYLDNDSQDYQLLAIFAAAINDSNAATIAVYNSYSPHYSLGVGLSNAVKINGIARLVATNSTADVTIVGVAGTTITNGVVSDTAGNSYTLPTSITIPLSGSIVVLATSSNVGSINSPAGSIININTPTLGWQSVNNVAASTPGNPVETDAQLRIRQSKSTSYPATSTLNAIQAAIANISGVEQSVIYENPTAATDTDGHISGAPGLPSHSIAIVTLGGDPLVIAQNIANSKAPGTGTYGSISEIVNVGGTTIQIYFSESAAQIITATITITPKTGYTTNIGNTLSQNFVNYINGLAIGQDYEFAEALGACVGQQYKLESIAVSVNSGSPTTNADISCPFNGNFTAVLSAITLDT